MMLISVRLKDTPVGYLPQGERVPPHELLRVPLPETAQSPRMRANERLGWAHRAGLLA